MSSTDGYLHGITGADVPLGAVESDDPVSRYHVPVLGSPLVALIAEPVAGADADALHLEARARVQDVVAAPWAIVMHGRHNVLRPSGRPTLVPGGCTGV
jgi:hypothetical protein